MVYFHFMTIKDNQNNFFSYEAHTYKFPIGIYEGFWAIAPIAYRKQMKEKCG